MAFLADDFFGVPLRRPVPQDLNEADDVRTVADGAQFSYGPQPSPVLPIAPALFASALAGRDRSLDFAAELSLLILFDENAAERPSQHVGGRPAENVRGARVPARHPSLNVRRDDGGICGAVYDLAPLPGNDFRRRICLAVLRHEFPGLGRKPQHAAPADLIP